jgi:RNA polymerase sigma-70 factor, ECF subfamily
LNRYVDPFDHDDVDGLVSLLREDATLRMPPQPSVIGALQVARFFQHTVARGVSFRRRWR